MKRLALAASLLALNLTPAEALINSQGKVIASYYQLTTVKCEKLAKQAVRSGFRKVAYPATKFTQAEVKADCEYGSALHENYRIMQEKH